MLHNTRRWLLAGFMGALLAPGPGSAQEAQPPSANSDPNYRALREGVPTETYEVKNLTLKRDAGTFLLRSERISFLAPVLDRVAMGVFVGEGEFTLTPRAPSELAHLRLLTEKETVKEAFDRLVLCFTDQTYAEVQRQAQKTAADPRVADVLGDFRKRVRRHTENPRSFLESLLVSDDVENIEAELLADLYNPNREESFNAYMFGSQHDDLRYHVRPLGVLTQLLAQEEVALIYLQPQGKEEGIWYLGHKESESQGGRASSDEDKRIVDVQHYRLETTLSGKKLAATAEVTFAAMVQGDRVLRFGLLPSLRVSRVTGEDGRDLSYIQEEEDADSAFYVVLPEPLASGKQYKLKIEYQGDGVVHDAGGGNFSVGARTSWYPSVGAFTDRATFDLTFKSPKESVLVGVGKKVKEWQEGNWAVSQWVSDVPLAVAGFNYGRFKKKEVFDEPTHYQIEGYATSDLPDYMDSARDIGGMSPSRLNDNMIVEAQNSMRLFSSWFGESPYGHIAITQQPEFSFGQSWPTLVYLPIIAYLDSTQRWRLLGSNAGLTAFIQEVTPHEVAHQWWGHMLGWASFHDQWLSEGFAEFSASLYLQFIESKDPNKYLNFWEQNRKTILEKRPEGFRPNDAGSIWMGLRLNTERTPGAYSLLIYPKGGYVLHMLRWMMYERQTGDQRFIAMMKDFVQSYLHQNPSTESFKRIVEKHMLPSWDLDGNRRMDWFFNQWVYGTEVPSYRFEYSLTPQSDGKVLLTGSTTQSGVSANFKMLAPIYLDFGGQIVRLGQVTLLGNTTASGLEVLLPQKPKRVLINAYYDVLAAESISKQK